MKGFSWLSVTVAITVVTLAGGSYLAYSMWRNYQFQSRRNNVALQALRSFEDCVKAGYPVAESYPRQCHAPDGRSFIEETKQ